MYGDYPVTKMVLQLEQDNLLPAILFRTSRRQCDIDIEKLDRSRKGILQPERRDEILSGIEAVIEHYALDREVVEDHPHYDALIRTGAGAHHAGQLLVWRLLLEELMTRGLLRMMIATGTVAAGVDFPARSVVITAHSKRGAEGFNVLKASEFQQMSGRAGRRGKDKIGVCLIAPGPFCDARVLNNVADNPPEPLQSAYFAAPSTVLNLLKFRNVDDLRYTVERSLAAFLDRKGSEEIRQTARRQLERDLKSYEKQDEQRKKSEKRYRRRLRDADKHEKRQEAAVEASLASLETLGHIESGKLTSKGYWAANLCTTLVLELAEAIDDGLFDELSVEELAASVASISGDAHRNYFSLQAPPLSKEHYLLMSEVVERVEVAYDRGPRSEVAVLPDASSTVVGWMRAQDWIEFSSYLRLAGVAEGDAARVITQAADHLNQLSRLTESHPKLAYAADEGRRILLRPPLTETLAVTATT